MCAMCFGRYETKKEKKQFAEIGKIDYVIKLVHSIVLSNPLFFGYCTSPFQFRINMVISVYMGICTSAKCGMFLSDGFQTNQNHVSLIPYPFPLIFNTKADLTKLYHVSSIKENASHLYIEFYGMTRRLCLRTHHIL